MVVSVIGGGVKDEEIRAYITYLRKKFPGRTFRKIDLKFDGDMVDISYEYDDPPFERIRRITGYLVGTLDRWNDGKRAEERDRVKHGVGDDDA